jgi:predicted metalloprotease
VRWRRVKNPDVIDQRGAGGGMGGMPFPMPGGRGGAAAGGLGWIAVLLVVLLQTCAGGGGAAFNLPAGFDGKIQAPGQPTGIPASEDADRDLRDFSTYVFTDAQETWSATFQRDGQPYENAQLVYYTGGVNTACGGASSAVGPFYCPGDQRVYLDLSFYRQMQQQLGAGGDFAWAYVIAHEMGHHVQQQTGTSEQVRNLQRQNPDQANQLSVRQELQADCYAGVWANRVPGGCARGGRPRGGVHGLRGGRRRPHPELSRRVDQPGQLHPRHLRAAPQLVQPRLRERRGERLRHLLAGRGLTGAPLRRVRSAPDSAETPAARGASMFES